MYTMVLVRCNGAMQSSLDKSHASVYWMCKGSAIHIRTSNIIESQDMAERSSFSLRAAS